MPAEEDSGGPALGADGEAIAGSPTGLSPRSTLRGFDRSMSPTLNKSMGSTGAPSSGFSFGRKTLGFWDRPNTVMMRNNVILHNTTGATGRAGPHAAPGPGSYNTSGKIGAGGIAYTLRPSIPAKTFTLPMTPAAASYSPDKRVLSPVKRAPSYTFGLSGKGPRDNGVPGPGAYGTPSDRGTTTAYITPAQSIAPRCGRSAIEPHVSSPGPAAHTPQHHRHSTKSGGARPSFSFGLRTQSSLKSVLTHDGHMYTDVHELSPMNKTPQFDKSATNPKVPGPGAYDVHDPLVGPKYSMGMRTSMEKRQMPTPVHSMEWPAGAGPRESVRTDAWPLPRSFAGPDPRNMTSPSPTPSGAFHVTTTLPFAPISHPNVAAGVARISASGGQPAMSVTFGADASAPGSFRPLSGITRPESGRERPESGRDSFAGSVPPSPAGAAPHSFNRPSSGRPVSGMHRPQSGVVRTVEAVPE